MSDCPAESIFLAVNDCMVVYRTKEATILLSGTVGLNHLLSIIFAFFVYLISVECV